MSGEVPDVDGAGPRDAAAALDHPRFSRRNTMPRITLRRLLAAAAGLAAVTATTAALASAGHPITEKMLAAAKVSEGYAFREDRPADVVLAKATVPAGASFGWHY